MRTASTLQRTRWPRSEQRARAHSVARVRSSGRYQNRNGGASTPQAESSNSGWLTSDKFNGGFSAMCWFFGRDLYSSLAASGEARPIGLIETNVGGTPDQHWSSPDALVRLRVVAAEPLGLV